ncbi:MAG: hypothetical protein A2Y95_06485 [Deltaproteobacteria bacterium RBG_13_65_10]|jgi:hypothetical protein|nr:MAG: hypothetical protein A2Y95_06485 [Deltaproteobacteria bacterium RBG_13_65_10]
MTPSIKGIGMQLAIDGLHRVMESGLLTREQLEVRLQPSDLQILDDKIVPGLWYPIDTCGRLIEVAVESEEKNRADFLVRVGTLVAAELFSSEIYQNFISSAEKWGARSGKVMLGLTRLVLNFGEWSYDPGPPDGDWFTVEAAESEALPEVLRHIGQGSIAYLASRINKREVPVTSERPSPDRIVYRGWRNGIVPS